MRNYLSSFAFDPKSELIKMKLNKMKCLMNKFCFQFQKKLLLIKHENQINLTLYM